MAAIDVGPGDITTAFGISKYTRIERTNPANDAGVLDTIFVNTGTLPVGGLKVGTFNSSTLVVNDFVLIGDLSVGMHTITGISCDVDTGNYLGTYFTSGQLGSNTSGAGTYAYSGDGFDGNSHSYTFYAGYQACVGATGETVAAGSKAFMHYYKNLMAGGVGRC